MKWASWNAGGCCTTQPFWSMDWKTVTFWCFPLMRTSVFFVTPRAPVLWSSGWPRELRWTGGCHSSPVARRSGWGVKARETWYHCFGGCQLNTGRLLLKIIYFLKNLNLRKYFRSLFPCCQCAAALVHWFGAATWLLFFWPVQTPPLHWP